MKYKKSNFFYLKINTCKFTVGEVVKIFYIVRIRRKKRVYNLIGLCCFKDDTSFTIYNKLKKEKILMTFNLASPAILKIFVVKMYKPFVFRISKIYFKKNLFLKEDNNFLNTMSSSINSYTFKFLNFFGVRRALTKKRHKKLKGKYRYRKIIDFKEYYKNLNISKKNKIKPTAVSNNQIFFNNFYFIINNSSVYRGLKKFDNKTFFDDIITNNELNNNSFYKNLIVYNDYFQSYLFLIKKNL